jgi:Kef-type K+ transport system membrane component KefB
MFSSTILITKLLPTTTLHQQHMGAVCIAVLVGQDILAVIIILLLGAPPAARLWAAIPLLFVKAAVLVALAFTVEQVVLRRMMRSSQRYSEVLMLLCLGWCLLGSVGAQAVGLTYEVGAFIAGVAVARGRIARVLSEELKIVRDFFLVFFFFALGAKLDLILIQAVWLPALLLAALMLALRPLYMDRLLRWVGEQPRFAREVGVRMGQGSEFALIIAAVGVASGQITDRLSQLIQVTVVLTMAVSAYVVATRYPTPISAPRLKKD